MLLWQHFVCVVTRKIGDKWCLNNKRWRVLTTFLCLLVVAEWVKKIKIEIFMTEKKYFSLSSCLSKDEAALN